MKRPLALLLLALCTGCPPPKPVMRPYPAPTPEELIAALQTRSSHLTSARIDAKVDHRAAGGQHIKVRVGMLLKRGGGMRLELEGPMGGAVATLATNGVDFQLLDTRRARFLSGVADPCNVARLIRLQLRPADLVEILLGSAPLDGKISESGWDASHGGREWVKLKFGDGEETLFLDSTGRRWDVVEAERRDETGRLLWGVVNEDFSDQLGGIRLPGKMAIDQPGVAEAKLRYLSAELNVEVGADQLRLTRPPGLDEEVVGCTDH